MTITLTPIIKKITLRNSDKELIYILEYKDKYELFYEITGYMHGGDRISKITFEGNSSFEDLDNYLQGFLKFKECDLIKIKLYD